MTLQKAEELARATDYVIESEAVSGAVPINWADASAFFLEGYEHALERKEDNLCDCGNLLPVECETCKRLWES